MKCNDRNFESSLFFVVSLVDFCMVLITVNVQAILIKIKMRRATRRVKWDIFKVTVHTHSHIHLNWVECLIQNFYRRECFYNVVMSHYNAHAIEAATGNENSIFIFIFFILFSFIFIQTNKQTNKSENNGRKQKKNNNKIFEWFSRKLNRLLACGRR